MDRSERDPNNDHYCDEKNMGEGGGGTNFFYLTVGVTSPGKLSNAPETTDRYEGAGTMSPLQAVSPRADDTPSATGGTDFDITRAGGAGAGGAVSSDDQSSRGGCLSYVPSASSLANECSCSGCAEVPSSPNRPLRVRLELLRPFLPRWPITDAAIAAAIDDVDDDLVEGPPLSSAPSSSA